MCDSVGAEQVIWDKVIVTITPGATNVTVGTQVNFMVAAVYAYDNKHVPACTVDILKDGVHFATNNFTDTCTTASTHQYTTEQVKETTYSLNAFTSNSATVIWTEPQKTFIQLLAEWIASNALIVTPTIQIIAVLMFVSIRECGKHTSHKGETPSKSDLA